MLNKGITGIRFQKKFAEGGIASAIGEIQNRKNGSDAMGERGISNLLKAIPKVTNMAIGGVANRGGAIQREEKTSDMKKLIDNIKLLLNTEIDNKRGGAAKQKVEQKVEEEKKTSKMKGRVTDKSLNKADVSEVVTQIEEEKLDDDKLLNDSVVEEVKGRFNFLKNMDPALARALIAGGSAMLRPTEGPVRSFLSLGEFGGAFADSLSKSDAAKTDLERLYATVVALTPEGEDPQTVQEFLLSQKEGSSDLSFAELSQLNPVILASLQTKFGKDDVELSDFAVQRGQDEDGEDIFVPLNIAIEDVRTNDDIRKLIKDSVLNPNAKQETGRTFFR